MKLMYRTTECTFVQWLSAILATTAASPMPTLALTSELIAWYESVWANEAEFGFLPDMPQSMRRLVADLTRNQCRAEI